MAFKLMRHFTLFSLCLCLLASCVSDEANRYYSTEHYPARDPSTVEILKSRPPRPFTVIADFQGRGQTASGLQRRAAKIGADAVIVTFVGGWVSTQTKWADDDPYADTSSRSLGTAIRYKK